MVKASTIFSSFSDANILTQIGRFIKHTRVNQNKTQAQVAEASGLNRWTLSQIENGESITLSSLIQILRALNQLNVLESFNFSEEISPLEYAKLKKKQQKERVRRKASNKTDNDNLGW